MRVAMVSFDTGEYCIRLAGGLAQAGAEVLLLLSEREAEPHLDKLNPAVRLVAFKRPRYRHVRQQMLLMLSLLHYIRLFKPDMVHLQMGHFWFNLTLPLLRQYPLVVTVHDVQVHPGDAASARSSQTVLDFGYNLADARIVHATALKQAALERFGWPDETVHVVRTVLRRDEDATEQPAAEEPNSVLFFGRIWPYKGLEYLIRAEPLISEQIPDIKIVIGGEGEDFARYRELMQHPERFDVHNYYISNEQRRAMFQRASIIVLPYIEASQSGVVPLAYSARKPVVATSVGGLPEIVDDGHTGYLVPPADERALAEAIIKLLNNPEQRRQFGLNGEQKILTESSPEVVARSTLDVYRAAMRRARQRAAGKTGSTLAMYADVHSSSSEQATVEQS
ncbi:MAG: glycosyltransferase family 4 protein [Chloroflexaceae bacterium]|nr:glycosyltransferase family 4 protein [Chloroflexaceae bacterium]NJL33567.1 glycosyltransferase family 4 protein [Chloroflexaceae bacterium]NJO05057.1 glycosyltransferase family 4 protein [Chloroflexaceae bacterium]